MPTTGPQDAATEDLVRALRDDVIPAATAGTGAAVHIGGANLQNAHNWMNGAKPWNDGAFTMSGAIAATLAIDYEALWKQGEHWDCASNPCKEVNNTGSELAPAEPFCIQHAVAVHDSDRHSRHAGSRQVLGSEAVETFDREIDAGARHRRPLRPSRRS